MSNKPTHICEIDCQLSITDKGKRVHMMYATSPTTAAGRYQYDKNREIYRMGKGARAAMRATGQSDTRTNREWNYGRKLFKDAADVISVDIASGGTAARGDAQYRDRANAVFGPDRRPFVKRSIRSRARFSARRESVRQTLNDQAQRISSQAGLASFPRVNGTVEDMLKGDPWRNIRPTYLSGSEHDPNL